MAPSNPSNRPTVNISADIQPSDFQAIGDVYVAAFKKTVSLLARVLSSLLSSLALFELTALVLRCFLSVSLASPCFQEILDSIFPASKAPSHEKQVG